MSMATALGNIFSLERQRARFESERLEHQEQVDEDSLRLNVEEIDTAPERPASVPEGGDVEEGGVSALTTDDGTEEAEEHEQLTDSTPPELVGESEVDDVNRFSARGTVSLAELEEERELSRRRSSACVMLGVFVLFRVWVAAMINGDFGLLLIALVGTSWLARWIRHNQDREEELDRRISHYLNNSEPGTTQVDRNDLRVLSFQAQLALAIMESQRQAMGGGYGHPDGENHGTPGVSEVAKEQWDRYQHKEAPKADKEGYGSVVADGEAKKAPVEDLPHCSICLGEYENGEELVKLPCKHIFHDECISSWCANHVRCPLCNFVLESAPAEP